MVCTGFYIIKAIIYLATALTEVSGCYSHSIGASSGEHRFASKAIKFFIDIHVHDQA